jgi:dolichol-phosphate mannosyltransferase
MKNVTVVLPTYNEAGNIEKMIHSIAKIRDTLTDWDLSILIVDSESQDETFNIVTKLKKKYTFLHALSTKKEGLGKAYATGFRYAIKHTKPYVLFEMDADLSHNPRRIPDFLKEIQSGADFVLGSRYIKGGSIPEDWAFHRKLFSVLGNLVIRCGFMNFRITDWTTGYRAMRVWVISEILPEMDDYPGYVFQVAGVDKTVKRSGVIKEIPIHFVDRKEGKSKINSLQFILQTLLYVLLESTFIKFAVVGLTGFIIDFALSFFLIDIATTQVWIATIISTEAAIISNFFLNNFWSFSHKKLESRKSVYAKSFIKFNFISSGSIAIQTIGMSILTLIFGPTYWYIFKIAIIVLIIIPYSYFFYNRFVWRNK